MNKNIIIAVLIVILVGSIGWVYFGKTKLQDQIKILENEKVALQSKIEKGLSYAKSLDLLFEPVRKQSGIPTRQSFSDDVEWISALSEAIKATSDSKLEDNLVDIKKGGNISSAGTVLFMEHSVSAIVDALK